MDTLPVTLIVKAPNQQFEDQTIKCEPTWSIRKLKGYLSEVYPCNPVSGRKMSKSLFLEYEILKRLNLLYSFMYFKMCSWRISESVLPEMNKISAV